MLGLRARVVQSSVRAHSMHAYMDAQSLSHNAALTGSLLLSIQSMDMRNPNTLPSWLLKLSLSDSALDDQTVTRP